MGVYINRVCIAIIINFQFKINSINSINLFNYNLFDSMATATTATAPSSARPITSHKQLVRNVLTDEATIITYCRIPSLGYTHQTVNHSQNFVDPTTGAHTNSIEGYWSCVKRQLRKQGVMNTSSKLFPTYLLEAMWRKRFSGEDLFEKLIDSIREQYPV